MRRVMVLMAAAAIVASACEVESVQPEPELLLPAPGGIERQVGDPTTTTTPAATGDDTQLLAPLPQVPGSGGEADAPGVITTPAPAPGSGGTAGGDAPSTVGRLVWSDERNGEALGDLAGAVIAGPFEVRLEGVGDGVDRVEWFVDGILFRNDDLDAPYNLRYFGTIPIDTTFGSDQGLAGLWELATGSSHTIRAVVIRSGGASSVEATFSVGDGTTPAPTTTTTTTTAPAPPTTTTAPAPTTTTPQL